MISFPNLAAAAAVAMGFAPGMATAAEFTLFVYETPQELALRGDKGAGGQAYWADYARFADVLKNADAIRGGAPLQLPAMAMTLDESGSRSGTIGRGALALSGYFRIEAADMKAAAALAAEAPAARRGGAIEVRETYPNPMMSK